jgi:hypothetical protein
METNNMSLQTNNLNAASPAAPANGVNVIWQADPASADTGVVRNVSGYVPAAKPAALGAVKPDGATMAVDANGTLSATGTLPSLSLTAATCSSSATSGSASALPASPTGYLTIEVGGTSVKIPYYSV